MKIFLAKAMGQCFGVNNAVKAALQEKNKNNLIIAGELVHNPQTVKKLLDFGIFMSKDIYEMKTFPTTRVMITAHGASEQFKNLLKQNGFEVEDATCPLVSHVHKTIKKMVSKGLFPVVIGHPEHVEVKGILGDLNESYVIYNEEDIEGLKKIGKKRLGIVSQTTNQPDVVENFVKKIKELECVEYVEFKNTVCQPTRDRQDALKELINFVECMVVIGGKNSSNTKKLVKICEDKNIVTYHIDNADELKKVWFKKIETVGVTAGTSTPENVINTVVEKLKSFNSYSII